MFLRLQKYGKRMTQQTFCTSFSPLQKIIRNFAKVMYSLKEGWKLMHSETGNRANRSRVHQSNAAYGGVVPVAHITTHISQIADRLHFADTPSFSKFFSRMKGMSPREYRELI
jgi:AraC-like DNA-binding protein